MDPPGSQAWALDNFLIFSFFRPEKCSITHIERTWIMRSQRMSCSHWAAKEESAEFRRPVETWTIFWESEWKLLEKLLKSGTCQQTKTVVAMLSLRLLLVSWLVKKHNKWCGLHKTSLSAIFIFTINLRIAIALIKAMKLLRFRATGETIAINFISDANVYTSANFQLFIQADDSW